MKTKDQLIRYLVIFIILLLFSSFLKRARRPKQTLILKNRCPLERGRPSFSLVGFREPLLPRGWRRYKQPEFGFIFDAPEGQWYANANIIQEFEEQLAFPKIEYSLYFSNAEGSGNSTKWEEKETAVLHFMVFDNNCQSLEEWLRFIPGSEKAKREEINIDGQKGIRLQSLQGYQADDLVIFNQSFYHYQFRLQVRHPEDLPKYSEGLTQIIQTFKLLEPEEKNEEEIQ